MVVIKIRLSEFRRRRVEQGLSQRALARRAGTSSGFLSQLEAGDRNPSPEMAKRLATALGADFDSLYYLIDEQVSDEHAAAGG